MSRRIIGIVTSARSDFGLLAGLIRAVRDDASLELILYVTGMHFSARHGLTRNDVLEAGFGPFAVEIDSYRGSDLPAEIAAGVAAGIAGFAEAFGRRCPDILVVLGDRYDALPAALAALPFAIPLAHISGGETTEGVIDEGIRHSLTKLAHLHFPSHPAYGARIHQMGEEDWRITVSGQPGLDAILEFLPAPKEKVFAELGLDLRRPTTLLTYHPETLAAGASGAAITEVLAAAEMIDSQILFTAPNADFGNRPIGDAIATFAAGRAGCVYRESLGRDLYLAMLRHADCMVGNSSSGIIEAASFELPVVDIGERQRGRLRDRNVIHCAPDRSSILEAWRRALDPAFRRRLKGLVNSYGDGKAVPRILAALKTAPLDHHLLAKKFVDINGVKKTAR